MILTPLGGGAEYRGDDLTRQKVFGRGLVGLC